MNNYDYINFPVDLLKNYFNNPKQVLDDILFYALWNYAKDLNVNEYYIKKIFSEEDFDRYNLTKEDLEENIYDGACNYVYEKASFLIAENKFLVRVGNVEISIKRGKELVNTYNHTKPPFSNIKQSIYFDYYKNEKDEWQNIMLLAFLGIRSIIGDKTYCKITNDYLFARMAGERKAITSGKYLPKEIKKYYTEHYKRMIRVELEEKWHMTSYCGRGYFASFDLEYKDLVKNIHKNSLKYRAKKTSKKKKEINEIVKLELENELKLLKQS